MGEVLEWVAAKVEAALVLSEAAEWASATA